MDEAESCCARDASDTRSRQALSFRPALQPTTGSVSRKPGLRHALLDQHRAFEGATTVWEAGAAAWRDVIALEIRIAEQAIELGELGERVPDAFLEQFGRDQERFADSGSRSSSRPMRQRPSEPLAILPRSHTCSASPNRA